MATDKMILLFGMPRSGTTWIGKLFDSHPQTFYLHEPDSVQADYQLPLLLAADDVSKWQPKLSSLINQWLQVKNEKVIASRPFFPKNYMNNVQWRLFQLSAYAGKALSRLGVKSFIHPIRWHQAVPNPIIVWKSIESLGRIGAIATSSEAMAIQLIRHPCGNIASTFKGESAGQFDGSVTIAEDWDLYQKLLQQSGNSQFSLQDVKAMQPEERLTVRWGLINDFALAQIESLGGTTVKYEDICRNPIDEVNRVFNHVQLDLPDSTMAYIKQSTSGHDDAYYSTQKDPLVSAYSWKKKLSVEQISNIKNMMANFKSGMLYQDDF